MNSNDNHVWLEGVKLFNSGHYWETHEVLETIWLPQTGSQRHFLAGVILLASALHQSRVRESPCPARRLYARGLRHLAWLPDIFQGVDVRTLEQVVLDALNDDRLIPSIPLVHSSEETGKR